MLFCTVFIVMLFMHIWVFKPPLFENKAYNIPQQHVFRVLISLATNLTFATFVNLWVALWTTFIQSCSCSCTYWYFSRHSLKTRHTTFLSSTLILLRTDSPFLDAFRKRAVISLRFDAFRKYAVILLCFKNEAFNIS